MSPGFESKMVHTPLGPNYYVDSYVSGYFSNIDRISND